MVERASRIGYLSLATLLAVGVLTQVFLVGLSLLGGQPSWEAHIGLGHSLSLLVLLMLILAYMGRLPSPIKPLTWITAGVYVLLADVVVFLSDSVPFVAALHPVLAVLLFALAAHVSVRAWRLVNQPGGERAQAGPEPDV